MAGKHKGRGILRSETLCQHTIQICYRVRTGFRDFWVKGQRFVFDVNGVKTLARGKYSQRKPSPRIETFFWAFLEKVDWFFRWFVARGHTFDELCFGGRIQLFGARRSTKQENTALPPVPTMARSKEVSPSKHSKDSEIKTSKDKTVDLSPKTKGAKVEKTKSGKDDGAGKNKSKLAFESVLVDDAKIKDKSTSEMVAKKNKSDSKRAGSKTGNDGEDTAGLAPDSVVEEEESARSQTTLFVRNLPNNFTSEDLEAAFSEIGPLRSAFVVGGRDFGFVR